MLVCGGICNVRWASLVSERVGAGRLRAVAGQGAGTADAAPPPLSRDFFCDLVGRVMGLLLCRGIVLGLIVEVLPHGSFSRSPVWSPSSG